MRKQVRSKDVDRVEVDLSSPQGSRKSLAARMKAAEKAMQRLPREIDAGPVSAQYHLMMEFKAFLASKKRMKAVAPHIGFAKPDSIRSVANEVQAETWKGYAVSIVVVVDKMRRG